MLRPTLPVLLIVTTLALTGFIGAGLPLGIAQPATRIVYRDITSDKATSVTVPGQPTDVDTQGGKVMWAFGPDVTVFDPATGKKTSVKIPVPVSQDKQLYDGKIYYVYQGYFYQLDPATKSTKLVSAKQFVNIDNLEVANGKITWNRIDLGGQVYRVDIETGDVETIPVPGLQPSEKIEGISGDQILVRRGCSLVLLDIGTGQRANVPFPTSHSDSALSGNNAAYHVDGGDLEVRNMKTGDVKGSWGEPQPTTIRLESNSLVYTFPSSMPVDSGPTTGDGSSTSPLAIGGGLVGNLVMWVALTLGLIGAVIVGRKIDQKPKIPEKILSDADKKPPAT